MNYRSSRVIFVALLSLAACGGNGGGGGGSNGGDSDAAGDADTNPVPVCTAGATQCTSDGLSVQACVPDGSAWGPEVSCNGTTCLDGACTTCAVGDTSCVPTCTAGQMRCSGPSNLVPQLCDDGGNWLSYAACATSCRDGFCTGTCSPSDKPACCQDVWAPDGSALYTDCRSDLLNCVGGPDCGPGHPVRIYIRGCDSTGTPAMSYNCGAVERPAGPYNWTVAQCGRCEETDTATCFDVEGNCVPQ